MPEGDTLRRAAEALKPVLEGRTLTEVWFRRLRGHRLRIGDRITTVEAVGKHLVITCHRGLALHTHLGMAGSWRVVSAAGQTPQSPRLRIVLGTAAGRALCFSAPTIETHLTDAATPLDRLGPDLSDDDADLDEVVRRTRELPTSTTAAELLLNQQVAAGVGNVFKSEALFVAEIHPFRTLDALTDAELAEVWTTAHRQLVASRESRYRSTTRPGTRSRYYVYGRHRKACLRCSDSIEFSPAGHRTRRSTYWCPSCQPGPREESAG